MYVVFLCVLNEHKVFPRRLAGADTQISYLIKAIHDSVEFEHLFLSPLDMPEYVLSFVAKDIDLLRVAIQIDISVLPLPVIIPLLHVLVLGLAALSFKASPFVYFFLHLP